MRKFGLNQFCHGINREWTDIQKVAFIDNAIGKKISYSPDFDTEEFIEASERALWHIIQSGYGVCNGIAQIEKYILDRAGIDSERVSGDKHSFLKLKNIEIPNSNGGWITGDTILDPTWNLAAHRYGYMPQNFCRSYEGIRGQDFDDDGTDKCCHKNDEVLASATLDLDEKRLREVFTSIGIADKDGNLPIQTLIEKAENVDSQKLPAEESIKKLLSLIEKYCPEFAICQDSTAMILKMLLNQENLKFNRCVVKRVYARDDKRKRPILYIYVELPNGSKKFYFADKDTGQFLELPKEKFEARFECYDMDMEKLDGHRQWEDIEKPENIEDLTRSSGKIVAQEGDGR